MFQPIPTPLFYQNYGVANANVPDYTFAPTPLGQGGNSGGGTRATAADHTLSPEAATSVYASPIFPSSHYHLENNPPQQQLNRLSLESFSRLQGQSNYPKSRGGRHHSVKMEPPSDLVQQEAAARDYKPELEVCLFPATY